MALTKENIAESSISDLGKLDRVINALCVDFHDVDKMYELKHEIQKLGADPTVDVQKFLAMGCKLGNCYNAIANQKTKLKLKDPSRHVSSAEERHAVKVEIWNYIEKMFHMEKIPKGYLTEIMSKLLKEEFR